MQNNVHWTEFNDFVSSAFVQMRKEQNVELDLILQHRRQIYFEIVKSYSYKDKQNSQEKLKTIDELYSDIEKFMKKLAANSGS